MTDASAAPDEDKEQHSAGSAKDKFCSLRSEKCPCPNYYQKYCDEDAAKWDARSAGSSKYHQRYKEEAKQRSQEAHHIACVASVTRIVTKNEAIDGIVRATVWCVNRRENMIALPLWPHTIEWYFNLREQILLKDRTGGSWRATVDAPPFDGLAQHDYDHNEYSSEVDRYLEAILDNVEEVAATHPDNPSGNLAGALNGVTDKYKATLEGRGTHAAWEEGMNETRTSRSEWYKAFSMTKLKPKRRAFPAPGNRLWKKMLETARNGRELAAGNQPSQARVTDAKRSARLPIGQQQTTRLWAPY